MGQIIFCVVAVLCIVTCWAAWRPTHPLWQPNICKQCQWRCRGRLLLLELLASAIHISYHLICTGFVLVGVLGFCYTTPCTLYFPKLWDGQPWTSNCTCWILGFLPGQWESISAFSGGCMCTWYTLTYQIAQPQQMSHLCLLLSLMSP